MSHKCAICILCNYYDACIECSLDRYNKIYENKENYKYYDLKFYRGDKQFLEFPFEIEYLNERNIRVSHPYFNCSELNLAPLLLIMDAIDRNYIGQEQKLKPVMKSLISVLIGNDNPRVYDIFNSFELDKQINIAIHDARKTHLISFKLIFEYFASNLLFISDIHDLTHHGAQTVLWPEFIEKLGKFGLLAYENNDQDMIECAIFLLYGCLEYSVIVNDFGSYSAGCMNWQSPRKSPAEMSQYIPICGVCINNWNSVRGVAALYRRQNEANMRMNKKYDWFTDLGYIINNKIKTKINSNSYNFIYTNYKDINKFSGPESVNDLFTRGELIMQNLINTSNN